VNKNSTTTGQKKVQKELKGKERTKGNNRNKETGINRDNKE
jgi:hypothetical protein